MSQGLRALKRPADAVAAAQEARGVARGRHTELTYVARELALSSGLMPEGHRDRARYGDLAVSALREALSAGPAPPGEVESDPDFRPLWPRKDFQALVYDPAFPADPFAR